MEEPQIVYIEEQFIENDNLPYQSNPGDSKNALEIILNRLLDLETKIMDRMDVLEICFSKQNQRIDEILLGTCNNLPGTTVEEVIEEVAPVLTDPLVKDEEDEIVQQSSEIPCIGKRKPENDESFVVSNKRQKPSLGEVLVVESYYEEPAPTVYKMIEDDTFSGFPFTNFDDARKFNKELANETVAGNFVRFLKRNVSVSNPLEVTEQILCKVFSDEILIESTWASKATGKLRISCLTNFLKCCLRFGNLYFENFGLNMLREQTIELLQGLRVENGLAPQSTKVQKSRRKSLIASITTDDVFRIGA